MALALLPTPQNRAQPLPDATTVPCHRGDALERDLPDETASDGRVRRHRRGGV